MLPDSTRHPDIEYCSTDEVPKAERLDYWASALNRALVPMSVATEDPQAFSASISSASLGPLKVTQNRGSAHVSRRTRHELARTEERCYHLIVSVDLPWNLTHRGQRMMQRGDLILHDSQFEHELRVWSSFDILNIRLPVEWLQTWIPDPDVLVGRRIARNSPWGTVLSPTVTQLRPDFVVAAPLAPQLIADHLGATLALVAGEYENTSRPDRVVLKRIEDCIQERCAEPGLCADQVASSLGISPQALHRQLASARLTFATRLLDARIARAVQLLRSGVERNTPLVEIARHAGFSQLPHFDRVIRKRFGCSAGDFQCRMLRGGDGVKGT
jgi:AraC family transcriptional regulator, positive regulator of tynA and feaB